MPGALTSEAYHRISPDIEQQNIRKHSQQKQDMLPIILLLGPCGAGKSTVGKRLARELGLYHLSIGDWQRSLFKSPIAGVPKHINALIAEGVAIPDQILASEYGDDWMNNMPPPLTLYVCNKANVSTPASWGFKLIPDLHVECKRISQLVPAPTAILLDNYPKNLEQAQALETTFGSDSFVLAIHLSCPEETAMQRFVARSRGSDNADTFRRRIRNFATRFSALRTKYESEGKLVESDTIDEPHVAYQKLMDKLAEHEAWQMLLCDLPINALPTPPETPERNFWGNK